MKWFISIHVANAKKNVILMCHSVLKVLCPFNVSATTGNENVILMQLDLSDLDSVHKFCKEFNEKEDELHLLINNAGIFNLIGYT